MRAKRLLASAVLLVALTTASGQQAQNPDLDRIRSEISSLKQRLEDVRRRARTAEQELEEADLELSIRNHELAIAIDVQKQLERERQTIDGQVTELGTRVARQKDYLKRRLIALYRLGGLSYLRMLLTLDQQRDPGAAIAMLTYLINHDSRMIQRFQSDRAQLEIRLVELADRQKKIAEATQVIGERRRAVAAAYSEKQRRLEKLRSEESGSQAQLAELVEKARRLERLVELLSRQQAGVVTSADIRQFRGALGWPVSGSVVEKFGRQRNAKFATVTMNNGLKIAASPRTQVCAVFQGTVLFTQWFKGYGNLIILDHGNRVLSLYGNLSGPSVAVGDRVAAGQVIAGVGESEDGKSGYLYFEVRQDNRPEDPVGWLR